jgi:hypothetical protein
MASFRIFLKPGENPADMNKLVRRVAQSLSGDTSIPTPTLVQVNIDIPELTDREAHHRIETLPTEVKDRLLVQLLLS